MPKPLKPVRQRDLVRSLAEVLIQSGVTVEEAVVDFHRALLEAALEEAGGNQLEAAKQQRMPRTTLRNQMISTGLIRGPKPLADQSTGLPQARADASERFPPPAPGFPECAAPGVSDQGECTPTQGALIHTLED